MSIILILAVTAIINKTQAQVRVSLNVGLPVYAVANPVPVVVYEQPYVEPCMVERSRPMAYARADYRYRRDYDNDYRRREMYERRENRYRDYDRYDNRGYDRHDNRYRH